MTSYLFIKIIAWSFWLWIYWFAYFFVGRFLNSKGIDTCYGTCGNSGLPNPLEALFNLPGQLIYFGLPGVFLYYYLKRTGQLDELKEKSQAAAIIIVVTILQFIAFIILRNYIFDMTRIDDLIPYTSP